MSIAHSVLILDYVSCQLKLVRSNTYKFFQNWLRVIKIPKNWINIGLKDNFFMIFMIFYEHVFDSNDYISKLNRSF